MASGERVVGWAKIDTVADSCLSAKFDFAFKGVVHFKLSLLHFPLPLPLQDLEGKLFKPVMNQTPKLKLKRGKNNSDREIYSKQQGA